MSYASILKSWFPVNNWLANLGSEYDSKKDGFFAAFWSYTKYMIGIGIRLTFFPLAADVVYLVLLGVSNSVKAIGNFFPGSKDKSDGESNNASNITVFEKKVATPLDTHTRFKALSEKFRENDSKLTSALFTENSSSSSGNQDLSRQLNDLRSYFSRYVEGSNMEALDLVELTNNEIKLEKLIENLIAKEEKSTGEQTSATSLGLGDK